MDQDIIVNESLPYPYAHYADAFIGFHKDLGASLTFCSCQRSAIENHLEMFRIFEESQKRGERLAWYVSAYADYPRVLLKLAALFGIAPGWALLNFMRFEDGLCHRCNLRLPYGPSIRPYINQAFYARGLHPAGTLVLPQKCPDEVKALHEKARCEHVENEVRKAFCFPPLGVNRNQESTVFLLVRQIFPSCTVLQHHRPDWLDGLELDIFVQDHNLGIEFQGIQHFEAMEHLGGEQALHKTQRRDKKKAALCKAHGVKLVFVKEGEALTDSNIRRIIRTELPSLKYAPPQTIERPPFDFHIPVQGQKLRWTYHEDKNELSVSGTIGAVAIYLGGPHCKLTVFTREGRVTQIEARQHNVSGAVSINLPVEGNEPQVVECHGGPKPMLEFFKLYSMFNPCVHLLESTDTCVGTADAQ